MGRKDTLSQPVENIQLFDLRIPPLADAKAIVVTIPVWRKCIWDDEYIRPHRHLDGKAAVVTCTGRITDMQGIVSGGRRVRNGVRGGRTIQSVRRRPLIDIPGTV